MKIDIFSDTVCPWCRIGKQNLHEALKEWQGEEVEVRFRAFQLDPTTPVEGRPFRETMSQKFGSGMDLSQLFGQVVRAGQGAGLHFDFDKVGYMPNTLLSHQVVALAPEGRQEEVMDAIFKAYFEDGRDIGSIDVLLAIAEPFGMETGWLRKELEAKTKLSEVEEDLDFAKQVGITGVPFFILNDKYAVSGAQPPAVFLQAMEKAAQG